MKKVLFTLLLGSFFITHGVAQDRFLIKVSPATPEKTKLLSNSGVKVYAKTADYYLAEATSGNLEYLKSIEISYEILDEEPEFALYYFVWAKPGEDIFGYLDRIKQKATVLEAEGERALIKGHPLRITELSSLGLTLKLIKKRALPIRAEEEFPALLEKKTPVYDSLIDEIIQKVTTSKLYDYVADLSGENEVQIGDVPETLLCRYTFSDGCDKAGQYLLEKFQSFGLYAYYDSFSLGPDSIIKTSVIDIVSTSSGDTVWLVCPFTGVWKTTNGGNNWNNIKQTYIFSIWSLSTPVADTMYGAGDIGMIIKSIDGGISWSQLGSPTTYNLRGIYFDNSQRGWVVGCGGTILYTTDGGQNWSIQTSNTSHDLVEITFIDSNNGWIVGLEGIILHTTDGGNNWSSQSSGTNEIIFGVDFVTPNKGWVCGQNGYIRFTTDAGTNWIEQTSGTVEDLYMVSAPDSLHAWVCGLGSTILKTTDAGTNWLSQSSAPQYGMFYEIYFLDTLKGWAVGYDDILYTTDGGQSWTQQVYNLYQEVIKHNVVAELPGQTEPGKQCLITAHYDATSEEPFNYTPGADDNASGTAAVLLAAEILKDYQFDYTLKFTCFSGEEQGIIGSEAYAEKAFQRGDTIIGVYNFDMIAWEGNDINDIDIHAGEGTSSQALADIMIGVINDYGLSLIPQKITTGATNRSDHASFWNYGYPAVLGIEDFGDFNIYYHRTTDRLSTLDLPYFTDLSKAGIASVAILAQPIQSFIYGDANGNGEITISDVVYIISHLYKGGPPPDPMEAGDANCDADVTVSDVIYLLNYLFKGGPLPGCRLLNNK